MLYILDNVGKIFIEIKSLWKKKRNIYNYTGSYYIHFDTLHKIFMISFKNLFISWGFHFLHCDYFFC